MFKNKALSLSVSMNPKPTTTSAETATPSLTPDEIAQIAMYHANHAAALIASLYVGRKVLNTACEIAVIYAQKRL